MPFSWYVVPFSSVVVIRVLLIFCSSTWAVSNIASVGMRPLATLHDIALPLIAAMIPAHTRTSRFPHSKHRRYRRSKTHRTRTRGGPLAEVPSSVLTLFAFDLPKAINGRHGTSPAHSTSNTVLTTIPLLQHKDATTPNRRGVTACIAHQRLHSDNLYLLALTVCPSRLLFFFLLTSPLLLCPIQPAHRSLPSQLLITNVSGQESEKLPSLFFIFLLS